MASGTGLSAATEADAVFRWRVSERRALNRRFRGAVVAALDVRVVLVTPDQQESMLVAVRERSVGGNLPVVDLSPAEPVPSPSRPLRKGS